MLAALCASLLGRASAPALPAPRYALDVRDAPTAAVFAMMLPGTETWVSRHFPARVTLRLTDGQAALPPPPSGRETYGDEWPVAGWIEGLRRAMGLRRMFVGYEREGGAFYVYEPGKPGSVGSDLYLTSPKGPEQAWHRLGSAGDGTAVPLPADVPLSGLRLAGVWAGSGRPRSAVVVARSGSGAEFARFVREGDLLGLSGWRVGGIEPGAMALSGAEGERTRLDLRGKS